MMLTQQRLKQVISYNPETGVFTWVMPQSRRVKAGSIAGSRTPKGYINIGIDGTRYLAHRLAWLYMHGEFAKEIDHANGDRGDNRIVNLRSCSRSNNAHNLTKPSHGRTSRHKGVHWAADRQKWATQICLRGERTLVGRYEDEDAAGAAYDWQAVQMFGEFAKTNGAVFIL